MMNIKQQLSTGSEQVIVGQPSDHGPSSGPTTERSELITDGTEEGDEEEDDAASRVNERQAQKYAQQAHKDQVSVTAKLFQS